MLLHPYHFCLLKCQIRQKLKGDYHFCLTHADRSHLSRERLINISESYIHKVLPEFGKGPKSLSPHTLDILAKYIGKKDWNDFLNQNKVPLELFNYLLKPKAAKKLAEMVEKRMMEILKVQMVSEL